MNCRSLKTYTFTTLLGLVIATPSPAQTQGDPPQVIDIVGNKLPIFWDFTFGFQRQQLGIAIWPGDTWTMAYTTALILLAQVRTLKDTGDVRCLLNAQLRNVVSTNDLLDRQIAAQAVFRALQILTPARTKIIQLGYVEVTYADGGTEKWPVPFPSFSDGGINQPLPGRTIGDGVAKPPDNPACKILG
jgi:hypothetical protein